MNQEERTDRLRAAWSALGEALIESLDGGDGPAPHGPTLLSMADAAEALGIARSTLYEVCDRGDIKTVYIGSRRFVPSTEVERLAGEAR